MDHFIFVNPITARLLVYKRKQGNDEVFDEAFFMNHSLDI
jgi:hypothetical protein